MSVCIALNTGDEFSRESEKDSRLLAGPEVNFGPSPSDIPNYVCATSEGRLLILTFEYPDTTEPLLDLEADGQQVEIGKNSGRVYKLVVDLTNHPRPEGLLNIDDFRVVDSRLRVGSTKYSRRLEINRKMAQQIVVRLWRDLVSPGDSTTTDNRN